MSKIKNMKLRYKIGAGVASGAALVGLGGAAFAYFTSTGTGTGSGSVGTATVWGVTTSTATSLYQSGTNVGSSPATYDYSDGMQPGVAHSDETVTVTITNNSKGYQKLNSFTIAVENSPTSPWTHTSYKADGTTPLYTGENACSANDFTLGGQSAAGSYTVNPANQDLAPGAQYQTTVTLHMLDTNVPQDNCQGTSPALFVSAI